VESESTFSYLPEPTNEQKQFKPHPYIIFSSVHYMHEVEAYMAGYACLPIRPSIHFNSNTAAARILIIFSIISSSILSADF
jgi:hypothetical protein